MQALAISLLKKMTGNPNAQFHTHQYEAIYGLVQERKKMLVVQKTGWGKSAVYFIATQLLRRQEDCGPTIIISPLIALMRNQIDSAARLGLTVVTINSSLSKQERSTNEQKIIDQEVDVIILSPEQLANENLLNNVLISILSNVGLFVVDEAHCISDWGHDFRPDYRRIIAIIQRMPSNMPILATTATANNRVIGDIQSQIGSGIHTLRGALIRDSLYLLNVPKKTKAERLSWLAHVIPTLPPTGIIYAKTISDCELVSDWLVFNNINAKSYHGAIPSEQRKQLEEDLIDNRLNVLVATSALGMGFDKPDIGFVIHFQAPGNVIEYYQQVGRAGRGIPQAYGILMLGEEDERIQDFFINNAFPSEQHVYEVLAALDAHDGLTKSQIEPFTNLASSSIDKVLKFLSVENPSPIYKDGSTYHRTAINYQLPYDRMKHLLSLKRNEWQQLKDYHQSSDCLMRFLANALDDGFASDCGHCANCQRTAPLDNTDTNSRVNTASNFIQQRYVKIKTRKQFGMSGALVSQAFPTYQFAYTNPQLNAENGLALSRWRDGVWGDIVAQGKSHNAFSDHLIDPMLKMIRTLNPEHVPTWLAYTPSLRHPNLVRNFAYKLAHALGIPCTDAVQILELRDPQKNMENTYSRSKNLDGLFGIDANSVYLGPVFLFDDAVDSGWTLTVIAALLRRQGAGKVYPIALTSTSNQG